MKVLVDRFSRRIDYLRLAVTDRCNLRCIYCMPPEGVPHLDHAEILTYEEILRFLRVALRAGIGKVRLTGGEPLVRRDVEELVRGIASLRPRLDISLTTNGTLLAKKAESLAAAGLKRVNVSIDSLHPETYRRLTRGGDLATALEGVEAALEAGLDPVKINVVTLKHLNDEVEGFLDLVYRLPVHVRFIEYMSPCGAVDASYFVSNRVIRARLLRHGAVEEAPSPLGAGPARYYRLPGARGMVGFISPVSSHFCPECNRLRLTAEGRMKPCLFSTEEVDVRGILRGGKDDRETEEEIYRAILTALDKKPYDHGKLESFTKTNMSRIGG